MSNKLPVSQQSQCQVKPSICQKKSVYWDPGGLASILRCFSDSRRHFLLCKSFPPSPHFHQPLAPLQLFTSHDILFPGRGTVFQQSRIGWEGSTRCFRETENPASPIPCAELHSQKSGFKTLIGVVGVFLEVWYPPLQCRKPNSRLSLCTELITGCRQSSF